MDFRTIFQLRDKKIWWLDVIFYFAVSFLVATVLCYLVFIIKNIIQSNQISEIEANLLTVGTQEQKDQETQVILYKQKINNFVELMKNHEFVSNVFSFLESQTQPNVWFTQFSLDEKNAKVQLSGTAENMDAFSRQTSTFENNEYVFDLGTINSSLSEEGAVAFNFGLSLDNTIFSYLVNLKNQEIKEEPELEITSLTGSLSSVETEEPEENLETNPEESEEPKSAEKKIFSFAFPLNPEVVGKINQTDYTILVDVPAQTDITNLAPIIVFSDKATVFPESDVSQNFTQPVIYEVKAEDETTQNYTVTVNVVQLPAEEQADQPKQSGLLKIFLIIAGVAFLTIVVLTVFLVIRNRKK